MGHAHPNPNEEEEGGPCSSNSRSVVDPAARRGSASRSLRYGRGYSLCRNPVEMSWRGQLDRAEDVRGQSRQDEEVVADGAVVRGGGGAAEGGRRARRRRRRRVAIIIIAPPSSSSGTRRPTGDTARRYAIRRWATSRTPGGLGMAVARPPRDRIPRPLSRPGGRCSQGDASWRYPAPTARIVGVAAGGGGGRGGMRGSSSRTATRRNAGHRTRSGRRRDRSSGRRSTGWRSRGIIFGRSAEVEKINDEDEDENEFATKKKAVSLSERISIIFRKLASNHPPFYLHRLYCFRHPGKVGTKRRPFGGGDGTHEV